MQLELGEARGQLRAAKAASHAAYERVEVLTAQLAAMEAGSPLGLIFCSFRVRPAASSHALHSRPCNAWSTQAQAEHNCCSMLAAQLGH